MVMKLTGSTLGHSRIRHSLLSATAAFWLVATPASAQWFGGFAGEAPIPPQGVMRMLANRGFSEVTRPRFDGEVYRVEATNLFGERVRITIDAFDGDIVDRQRIAHASDPFEEALTPPQNVGRGRALDAPPAPPRPAPIDTLRTDEPRPLGQQQAARSEPPRQARKPTALPARPPEAQPAQSRISPPSIATSKRDLSNKGKPTEVAVAPAGASRPVRIIGGVTPLNPEQSSTAKPTVSKPTPPETPPL